MNKLSLAVRAAAGAIAIAAAGCAAAPQVRAARDVRLAQRLAQRGRADEAIERLYSLLDTQPQCVDAHLLLIRLRSPAARAVVHKEYLQRLRAEPENALMHFLAGYSADGPSAQVAHYGRALALDPDLAEAQLEMARVCRTREVNEPVASLRAIENAVALRPEWAEAHIERARSLAALGETQEAIAACRRAIQLEPSHEAAWFELACLQSVAEPAATEPTLAEAVRRCPASGRLWWHLADFQWARGAWREAEGTLERALALEPGAHWAREGRNRLAACYLSRGRHREARALGATIWQPAAHEMAAGRLSPQAFRLLRVACLGNGPERVRRLQEAARHAPASRVVACELGDALLAAGSFASAAAAYAGALEEGEGRGVRPAPLPLPEGEVRVRCARAELLAGRPSAALAHLGAERRQPSREAAWLVADAEGLKAGNLALEAIIACHTALQAKTQPSSADGAARRARHAALRACIEKFPAYLTPRLALAHWLAEKGGAAEARAVLEAAAAMRGHALSEADCQLQLGELALAAAEPARAAKHFLAAIERSPDLARAHGALARARVAAGELGPALDALSRQLALDPESYDLVPPNAPGEAGHLLVPRFERGDALRYRYSTDGGQPGRKLACVDFDYVVETVSPGHLVHGRIEVVAVSGRAVEGGIDLVGARSHIECSACFGLVAADRPARGVPREFADLLWLVQLLHGPALPIPRRTGQSWQSTAWTERGRVCCGPVEFVRLQRQKAYLGLGIRHEREAGDTTTRFERVAAEGRAEVVFDLARQVVERVELRLHRTVSDGRGSDAALPPWLHRLELVRIERGADKSLLRSRL